MNQYHGGEYFQIADAVQLTGFQRSKRGYRPLYKSATGSKQNYRTNTNKDGDSSDPTDPLFRKEWYLVSLIITSSK